MGPRLTLDMSKYIPSKQTIKERCTSIHAWELPKQSSALAPAYVWTNKDMDPTPPEDQTWTLWTWMAYWATDTINLGTWETASSIIAVGLTWREAIPIMVVGTFCVAVPMVLNGAIGAALHVPFSVIVRSGFGYYFAYFCIISRSILAMFWLGIQGANGALAIQVMISSIWPSFNKIPNHIARNQGITTEGMICYFLFWIIQLPLLLIPPTKLRWLFIVKIVAAPIAAIATLGWCVHKAGSGGALFHQQPTVTGSEYAYQWLSCMSSVTGSWATLACNIPDFSRYARSSKGQYIQLPFLPIIFTICGILGIVTTSASKVIWDEYYWNPLDIMIEWQKYGHRGRAAAFFAATAWYIAQVGTNITANSISAANDLTVLFPRWINIFRGCIVAAVVGGWVIVPWKIISSAETFLSFMSGYSVFLAPIAGIIASDYWLVKRRAIDVPALYDPQGRYRYFYGVNWQGLVAFLIAMTPNLPGLAHAINPGSTHVKAGILHLYSFCWLYGFVMSIFIYTGLHYLFPWKRSLVPRTIDGVDTVAESKAHGPPMEGEDDEKNAGARVSEQKIRGEGYGYANVDPIHRAKDVWN
ncbi:uridine permease-like protein Fui1 [Teratosphaeria nubilosa]|uniref:Uridine permease-like protein Fui1 n=1 Tax=Teratosphaeria nubilosa TaxID=161662 RepID=A0A6G1LCU4_9PEZI|nr:uridine permease-like protein Fui1 [Teratosphaeria nubilosa]